MTLGDLYDALKALKSLDDVIESLERAVALPSQDHANYVRDLARCTEKRGAMRARRIMLKEPTHDR